MDVRRHGPAAPQRRRLAMNRPPLLQPLAARELKCAARGTGAPGQGSPYRRRHSPAHSNGMALRTHILDDPGASKHLRVSGAVGNTHTFTDADVRDDLRAGQLTLEQLRRGKFVLVEELRVGQRDGIYTVRGGRWSSPRSRRSAPRRPLCLRRRKNVHAPERRRPGAADRSASRPRPHSQVGLESLGSGKRFIHRSLGPDTHAHFVGIWSRSVGM